MESGIFLPKPSASKLEVSVHQKAVHHRQAHKEQLPYSKEENSAVTFQGELETLFFLNGPKALEITWTEKFLSKIIFSEFEKKSYSNNKYKKYQMI
jgi:hypothetical protein